jgi:hypothetical protein
MKKDGFAQLEEAIVDSFTKAKIDKYVQKCKKSKIVQKAESLGRQAMESDAGHKAKIAYKKAMGASLKECSRIFNEVGLKVGMLADKTLNENPAPKENVTILPKLDKKLAAKIFHATRACRGCKCGKEKCGRNVEKKEMKHGKKS